MASADDLYAQNGDALDTFISQVIQPTDQFNAYCNKTVDQLVHLLQCNMPARVQPRRVIKGGSLCKGTAVLDKSDIDITLMLLNYTDVPSLEKELPKLLDDIKLHLPQGIRCVKITPFSLELEIRCSANHVHSADVLPAVDVIALRPSLNHVYEEMKSMDETTRRYYRACLSPLQKNFFPELPTKLKSLIRLVKYWNKTKLDRLSFRSYFVELVILNAWCQASQPVKFTMKRAVHAVLTSLTRHEGFRVVFPKGIAQYDKAFPDQAPYIMDPVNPYRNIYPDQKWDGIAREARRWLSRPAFQGVHDTTNRWCTVSDM